MTMQSAHVSPRLLCVLAFTISFVGPAGASMRSELSGHTLHCAGGNQIAFTADGASASIVSPVGTKVANKVRWQSNSVELYTSNSQSYLTVERDADGYAFQEAPCK
jgi:hypothetical protein